MLYIHRPGGYEVGKLRTRLPSRRTAQCRQPSFVRRAAFCLRSSLLGNLSLSLMPLSNAYTHATLIEIKSFFAFHWSNYSSVSEDMVTIVLVASCGWSGVSCKSVLLKTPEKCTPSKSLKVDSLKILKSVLFSLPHISGSTALSISVLAICG